MISMLILSTTDSIITDVFQSGNSSLNEFMLFDSDFDSFKHLKKLVSVSQELWFLFLQDKHNKLEADTSQVCITKAHYLMLLCQHQLFQTPIITNDVKSPVLVLFLI